MRQRMSFITLGVQDVTRSRTFYRAMGWQEAAGSRDSVAFFRIGALTLALFSRSALADDAGVPAQGSGFSGITLSHNVMSETEVDAVLTQAVAAGGRLVRPGSRAVWGGWRGYFADPDGYLWEVCFNPVMPLNDVGELVWPVSDPVA